MNMTEGLSAAVRFVNGSEIYYGTTNEIRRGSEAISAEFRDRCRLCAENCQRWAKAANRVRRFHLDDQAHAKVRGQRFRNKLRRGAEYGIDDPCRRGHAIEAYLWIMRRLAAWQWVGWFPGVLSRSWACFQAPRGAWRSS